MVHILADAKRQTRDWPEFRSRSIETRLAFEDGFNNGFWDNSWNAWVQPASDSKNSGMMGSPGLCAKVYNKVSAALMCLKCYLVQNLRSLNFLT